MTTRAALVTCLLLSAACDYDPEWGPEELGGGHPGAARAPLELGRRTYSQYCAGCHGDAGDGAGPAARFMNPAPRDFRKGLLKFAGVSSGEVPRDDDYLTILDHGLSGTAMPSFALLSVQEKTALVAYVRSFATRKRAPGTALVLPRDPFAANRAAGVAEGRKIYHSLAQCWSCHPAYATREEIAAYNAAMGMTPPELPERLYRAEAKESSWGAPIRPPDFLFERIKTGLDVDSLALVIGSGVGGTAMPSWVGALKPEQLWGLAYYVRSLALLRGTRDAGALRSTLTGAQP